VDRELDLTGLEPPEPLQRVLDALVDLPPEERLRVQLRHEPFPLYAMLRPMGYEWSGNLRDDGFDLLIWGKSSGQVGDDPSC